MLGTSLPTTRNKKKKLPWRVANLVIHLLCLFYLMAALRGVSFWLRLLRRSSRCPVFSYLVQRGWSWASVAEDSEVCRETSGELDAKTQNEWYQPQKISQVVMAPEITLWMAATEPWVAPHLQWSNCFNKKTSERCALLNKALLLSWGSHVDSALGTDLNC